MRKFLITLLGIFIFTFGINIVNTYASTINIGEQKNFSMYTYQNEQELVLKVDRDVKIKLEINVNADNIDETEIEDFNEILSLDIEVPINKDSSRYNSYYVGKTFYTTLKLNKGKYSLYFYNDNKINFDYTVKITDVSEYTKQIKLNKIKYSNYEKETVQLKVSSKQKGKYVGNIIWKSSNTKVATVNKNGKVTLKKKGKCTITAKVKGCKKVKCKITVKKRPEIYIKKFGFTMDYVGGVEPYFLIENNTGKKIKYIYTTVYFYNRVGDSVYCNIQNTNSRNLKMIGPFKDGKTKSSHFSPAIYNGTTYKIKIKSVKVEFMNGKTKTYNIKKTGKEIE